MRTIEYKVSYENMISRLPALFAYLEENEVGEMVLHKASDSPIGCYGKIVENIVLKGSFSVEDIDPIYFEERHIEEDDKPKGNILENGQVYSYRTLMYYYYEFKDYIIDGGNTSFFDFIDKAIGMVEVDEEIRKEHPMVPCLIYLADARNLYNDMVKLRKRCDLYKNDDVHLCCDCEKYENLNGDKYIEFLKGCIGKAKEIANEYYGYANDSVSLELNVDLMSSYQDLGIMTPSIPEWIPYKRYYGCDKVYYKGSIQICTCKEGEYTTGKWDDELEKVVFDVENFEDYETLMLNNDEYVMEKNENGAEEFIKEKCRFKTETVHVGEYDETSKEWKEHIPNEEYKIKGRTDSKLTDLRRSQTFLNMNNVMERPKKGEDWLYFYRKGVPMNIRTLNDEFGNILYIDNNQGVTAKSSNWEVLLAYGDVIEEIEYNKEEHTIKFVYRIGAHLIATFDTMKTDDDGNELYFWKDFVLDDDTHNEKYKNVGMRFEETYNYLPNSDLAKLIDGGYKIIDENGVTQGTISFKDYIDGKYDKSLKNVKFEFSTLNNTYSYDKRIANQEVHITSLLTDFEVYHKPQDFNEFMKVENIRLDYYNGISYSPTRKIDVHIERGSTSVFDKHIRLSEVKTFEDMESYENGSFFPINEG